MKKIIFDTDIGGDCDDAGALALLHECERAGRAELIARHDQYGQPVCRRLCGRDKPLV